MRFKPKTLLLISGLLLAWLQLGTGCSTTEVTPTPPPETAALPVYISAPHPEGYTLGDLSAVLVLKEAPAPGFSKTCDESFVKLLSLTQSQEEQQNGVRELVKSEPLHFHWCFYSKIAALHEDLLSENFIDQKQKSVLDAYAFLVPVARAFISEFRDSRYLRWAVKNYRQVSEWVFFRRLELTPQLTSELVDVSNPFGAWKDITPSAGAKVSVKDKYGVSVTNPYIGGGAVALEAAPARIPAATPSAIPSAVPSL